MGDNGGYENDKQSNGVLKFQPDPLHFAERIKSAWKYLCRPHLKQGRERNPLVSTTA